VLGKIAKQLNNLNFNTKIITQSSILINWKVIIAFLLNYDYYNNISISRNNKICEIILYVV